MPPRPKVELLPADIRKQLDSRIIVNHFGGYEVIAAWLAHKGYPIRKSTIGAYALTLKAKTRGESSTASQPCQRKEQDWRRLPEAVRLNLARRLLAGEWTNCAALAAWLEDQGHPIGKGAVQAYAAALSNGLAVADAIKVGPAS